MMKTTNRMKFKDSYSIVALFGDDDENLRKIEKKFKVEVTARGNNIAITGAPHNVESAERFITRYYNHVSGKDGKPMMQGDFDISLNYTDEEEKVVQGNIKTRKSRIVPKTKMQATYIEAMGEKDVVFSIGAAGTGKTYLAVAMAVEMFLSKKVERIILSRPAVEAGEKLGFLPGDMREKVDPYLRPLYDSLYDMLPPNDVERYFTTKEIEIAPLAFMRGRTLSNAFVILDEAQNCTSLQMKMFLTRLGHGSKMIITGDITQIDLPNNTKSGLIDAIEKLKTIKEIAVVKFNANDVIRHPLTTKIIQAYEQT